MEPLEVTDFSGGITDYPLQGATTRAERMDNFLITQDKKLVERDGYKLPSTFDSTPFTDSPKIDKLLTIENREKLLAMSQGVAKLKDKYLTNDWIAVTGDVPSGGQISSGEYADTTYLTSDLEKIPRKIYQDENGNYVTRRVGLPKALSQNPMTETTLLAQCLALANDLRSKFILHMADSYYDLPNLSPPAVYLAQKSNVGKIHQARDRKALSYFQAETVGIEPNQSDFAAAPAATNYSTLFDLTRALLYSFRSHVADASIDTPNQKPYATNTPVPNQNAKQCWYHWILRPKKAVSATMVVSADAPIGPIEETEYYDYFVGKTQADVTIVDIAKALNELREKYNNHRMGVHLHDFYNQPLVIDKYAPAVAKIEDIYTEVKDGRNIISAKIPPKITPDYSDLINFVNNIFAIYRKHIGVDWSYTTSPALSTGLQPVYHIQVANSYDNLLNAANNDFIVNLPYATTIEEAKLLLYHLRAQYIGHDFDARPSSTIGQSALAAVFGSADQKILFAKLTGDFNAASTIVANTKNSAGVSKQINFGSWLWTGFPIPPIGDSDTKTNGFTPVYASYVARATSPTAIDRFNVGGAVVGTNIHASMSKYHAFSVAGALVSGESSTVAASASNLIQSDATKMPSSVAELASAASELFFALASHILDPSIHVSQTNTSSNEVNSFSSGFSKYFLDTMIKTYLPNAPFFVPEAGTVNYAFFFSDEYKVNQFQQVDRLTLGAPVYVGPTEEIKSYKTGQVIESQNPLVYADAIYSTQKPTRITNLPALSGYDSDIKMNIYRTSLNGQTFFNVDEIDNGTTSYLDYSIDDSSSQGKSSLVTRQEIYTTGGVVGFDQVEGAKFVHVVNNKAYYAGIIEDGKLIKNRLLQSINGAPDAVPASFFDDFDDEIVGLSSARSNLIVFCKNSIYRESGEFGETGQGFLSHEKISDVVGGLNQLSIVQTEIGVFFAGTDGIYYTDGYQIIKISLEIDLTYRNITKTDAQKLAIEGSYDTEGRRIWFSVKLNEGDISNKMFFVLHLNDGVKPSAAFTKVFGTQIGHTTHIFWNDAHYLGGFYPVPNSSISFGFISFSDPYQKSDEVFAAGGSYTEAIKFDYRSCALDAGSIFTRKYAIKMHVLAENHGNVTLEPYVIRDKNSDNIGIRPMAQIDYRDNLEWGQPSCLWGQADTYWNNTGKLDEWRRFPRTTIRSDVFQVGFRNSDSIVYNSDSSYFPANTYVNISNDTDATIVSYGQAGVEWPLDLAGMRISFDYDNYETEYTIDSQSDAVISFSPDFPVTSLNGLKFLIKGFKKNQRAAINSYVVNFARIGDEVKSYVRGGNSGQN